MLVPPERGTIIGRALWKVCLQGVPFCFLISNQTPLQPRYVVLGSGSLMKTQNDILAESQGKSSSKKGLKSTSSKPSLVDVSQQEPDGHGLYISIYKAKVRPDPVRLEVKLLNSYRAIGNSYRKLLCPPSSPAKFEPYSTENKGPPCQH
jgi:hypothetical protein